LRGIKICFEGFERNIARANRIAFVVQLQVRVGEPMPVSFVEEIRKISGVAVEAPRSCFYYSHGEEGVGALVTNQRFSFA
jgi:hypothetical protein